MYHNTIEDCARQQKVALKLENLENIEFLRMATATTFSGRGRGIDRRVHTVYGRHVDRVVAVATRPDIRDRSSPVHDFNIRAQRMNQRLNEQLWQERLKRVAPSTPPMPALREEALRTGRWYPEPHHMSHTELWECIKREAAIQAKEEPVLASFLHMTVIMHASLGKGLAFLLANKLASSTLLGTQLTQLIVEAYEDEPELLAACVADLEAVHARDPACQSYLQGLVFFKGFQALQVHRVAHWMWRKGRQALALALQSRMSEVFAVDIHPAASIGKGVMMDHASGIVIGETAVVGDNVCMLHHVTLGGSGTGTGTRHPIVGNGVLLGAGVSVLGPVVVGHSSKIGAGSVVVTDVPAHCVAVGVPAKVVNKLKDGVEPTQDMDQTQDFILDYVI